MKNKISFVLIAVFLLGVTSCVMPTGQNPARQTKTDKEVLSNMTFEPLEWKDEYVSTVTYAPFGIQVWNSITEKNVYNYNLDYFTVMDMEIFNKTIWAILMGNGYSLVRIDIETGKIHYVEGAGGATKLCKYLDSNGKEIILEEFYGTNKGIQFRKFDSNGNKIDTFYVKPNNQIIVSRGIKNINGTLYLFAQDDINNDVIYFINLDTKAFEVTSFTKLFSAEFLNDILSIGMTEIKLWFWVVEIDGDSYINLFANNKDPDFTSIGEWRFKIKQFFPLEVEKVDSNFNVRNEVVLLTTEDKIYLYQYDENKICIYNKSLGLYEEEYTLSKVYSKKNSSNKLFFSRDTWTFDDSTETWDESGQPSIYVYNLETEKMEIVYADGTREEVAPEVNL